jgi:hypothetical protein
MIMYQRLRPRHYISVCLGEGEGAHETL